MFVEIYFWIVIYEVNFLLKDCNWSNQGRLSYVTSAMHKLSN